MMELFRLQNAFFILILYVEFSMFVDASSKRKGIRVKPVSVSSLKSAEITGGLPDSTEKDERYDPKQYHQPYGYKKPEIRSGLCFIYPEHDFKKSEKIIEVNKVWVFEQTYRALKKLSVEQLLNCELHLEGDSAAVNRWKRQKWYSALMLDIFDHHRGLYRSTQNNSGLLINPASIRKKDYIDQFRFIGKMFAFGIYKELHPNTVQLGRMFLKTILQRNIHLIDVEAADPKFYKQLMNVKEEPTNYVFTLNGKALRENGAEIGVTKWNVNLYIKLAIEYKYNTSVSKQIEAFLDGFNWLIPLELLNNFKPSDLEILIYGDHQYRINVDDWVKNTTVVKDPEDEFADCLVDNFWEILRSNQFDDRRKLQMLYFITGTTRYKADEGERPKGNLFEIYVDLDKNGNHISKIKKKPLPSTDITAKRLYLTHESKADLVDKLEKAVDKSEPFS